MHQLRIIFGLSLSDILFSLGMLLSPFMGPEDNPNALFAIGTTESCEAIGFIFIMGFCCTIYYTVFLTYYFMRRIKYKVTAKGFAKKEEKYLHLAILLLSLSAAISALLTGSLNPQNKGSVCTIGTYPPGCDKSSDMVCERGESASSTIMLFLGLFFGALYLALIVTLALTTHHVFKVESNLPVSDSNREADTENNGRAAERRARTRLFLTKEAFHQSLRYIAVFFFVYLGPVIAAIQMRFANVVDEPQWRFWLTTITPLGGIFNILIYTRPKVLKLEEMHPDIPRLKLFLIIILTGGDIPSMIDVQQLTPTIRRANDNQRLMNRRRLRFTEVEESVNDDEEDQEEEEEDNRLPYDLDTSRAEEILNIMYFARYRLRASMHHP
ncbi:hypothetical protein CTEN210_01083 [Chaetoceros tenuissimus]|uniref:Uncharacterized protein n=1 Tax=Chaetoceros tenuissimus TaxID=426638 RepID=A0AAD3CGR8_9STRA|nr:hypothetical protein CTEN210_01083 [Chaetoceros tenuissimus]